LEKEVREGRSKKKVLVSLVPVVPSGIEKNGC